MLTEQDDGEAVDNHPALPTSLVDRYQSDGFIAFPEPVLERTVVAELNRNLEEIFRGRYTKNHKPDKQPKLFKNEYRGSSKVLNDPHSDQGKRKRKISVVGPLGFSGNLTNVKVLQIINAHKADTLFHKVALDPTLGKVVATLTGWKDGVRLMQDQVWAKPPRAPALAFHRDQPYFMMDPPHIVTVWIALDDMERELGPLLYVVKSHQWEQSRCGIAGDFFQEKGGLGLLQQSANDCHDLAMVSMEGMRAGGLSIHNGLTWHGSHKNASPVRPRRGLGLHFCPKNVRWTAEAVKSKLWKPYVQEAVDRGQDPATIPIRDEDFPVTWHPGMDQG